MTEASTVVPKGSVQFENGLTYTAGHGNGTVDLAETLMRVGIFSRTEIRVVILNYVRSTSGPNPVSGFDDMAVGLKQQIGPLPGGIDLSVIAAVSLPSGENRIGTHGYDRLSNSPGRELAGGWSIGGMQSVFWYSDAGRRNRTWEPTFYLERELTKRSDAFVEYAGDFAQRGGSRQIAHCGAAYRIRPHQQVDFHFGFGLTHDAPSRFIAVGYSVRIDRGWNR